MARPRNLSEHDPQPGPFRSAPIPQLELPAEHPEFTPYLDRVCAPLNALAPAEWVADLRAELACHLECTAEAYEELGETPEQAARSACRSLGDPARLARRWERFWQDRRPEPFRRTFGQAFAVFTVGALLSLGLLLLSTMVGNATGGWLFVPAQDTLILVSVLGMPITLGAVFGRWSRGRRALGAAAGVLAVAAVTALIDLLLPGGGPADIEPFLWQIDLVYWLPLGTAAAWITGLLCARREARRLQRGA